MIQYNCPYRVYSIGIYKQRPFRVDFRINKRPLIIRHSIRTVLLERRKNMEKTYIGYARVSTEEQNTARQLQTFENYSE